MWPICVECQDCPSTTAPTSTASTPTASPTAAPITAAPITTAPITTAPITAAPITTAATTKPSYYYYYLKNQGTGDTTLALTCGLPNYKGDGQCDDNNNNVGCEYDGGDCCFESRGAAVQKDYCEECKCLDPRYSSSVTTITQASAETTQAGNPTTVITSSNAVSITGAPYSYYYDNVNSGGTTLAHTCVNIGYKGDGACDDENNNVDCEYDGGDCCAESLGKAVSTEFCTECKCLDPKYSSMATTTIAQDPKTTRDYYYYYNVRTTIAGREFGLCLKRTLYKLFPVRIEYQ